MIAPHTDDARNYPIDMCWSVVKGLRASVPGKGIAHYRASSIARKLHLVAFMPTKGSHKECGSAAYAQMHSRDVYIVFY